MTVVTITERILCAKIQMPVWWARVCKSRQTRRTSRALLLNNPLLSARHPNKWAKTSTKFSSKIRTCKCSITIDRQKVMSFLAVIAKEMNTRMKQSSRGSSPTSLLTVRLSQSYRVTNRIREVPLRAEQSANTTIVLFSRTALPIFSASRTSWLKSVRMRTHKMTYMRQLERILRSKPIVLSRYISPRNQLRYLLVATKVWHSWVARDLLSSLWICKQSRIAGAITMIS